MSESTVTISVSEYDRLLQIERDLNNPSKYRRVVGAIFEASDGKIVFVPRTVNSDVALKPCVTCGRVAWMIAPDGKYECGQCRADWEAAQ